MNKSDDSCVYSLVANVPLDVYTFVKTDAARRGVSVSLYLRSLIQQEKLNPTVVVEKKDRNKRGRRVTIIKNNNNPYRHPCRGLFEYDDCEVVG
jgi:hypothetical protein